MDKFDKKFNFLFNTIIVFWCLGVIGVFTLIGFGIYFCFVILDIVTKYLGQS